MRTIPGGAQVVAFGGADSCDLYQTTGVPLAINEPGQVAYVAQILDAIEGFVDTVVVDSSKVWDARDPAFRPLSGPLLSAAEVALNDSGEVAFLIEGSDMDGVYTGSDPVSDKVLAIGDPLCGSTVTAVYFHRYGLDSLGRLALAVDLADARRLIVRADPTTGPGGFCETAPELEATGAATAAIAGLLGVATRRRRCASACTGG